MPRCEASWHGAEAEQDGKMTAIISIVESDAVHFLTDGAAEHGDGSFSPMQKAMTIAHLPAIVVVRGPSVMLPLAAAEFSLHRNFDEMLGGISSALHRIEVSAQAWLKTSAGGVEFDCYVAGHSKQFGWCAHVVCNHFRYPEVLPFQPSQMPGISYAPTDEGLAGFFAGLTEGLGADEFNPTTHGLRLMREQRASGGPTWAGGFCQLTSVSSGGARSRILEHWREDFRRNTQ